MATDKKRGLGKGIGSLMSGFDFDTQTEDILTKTLKEETHTTGTLISKIDEVAINAKTANWKAIVMFLILQSTNKRIIYHLISLSVKKL